MSHRNLLLCLIVVGLFWNINFVFAQTPYSITQWTLANSSALTSETYNLSGIVGEIGGDHLLGGGFMLTGGYMVTNLESLPTPSKVYLPLVQR